MNPYEKIQQLTNERGISVRELEKRLGYSNGYFSKWKKVSPNSDGLAKVADYFGVSVDYLLGREKTNTSSKEDIDPVEKMLGTVMSSDGKPLTDNDKEILRGIIAAYLENKK